MFKIRVKLKTQYALFFGGLIALLAIVLSAVLLVQFREFSQQSNQASTNAITETSIVRATEQSVALADQLSNNLVNPLYYLDFRTLGNLLEVALAHPDIESVMVLNKDLHLIHKGGRFRKEFGLNIELDLNQYELFDPETYIRQTESQLQIIKPIQVGDDSIGWLLVDYSLTAINYEIARQTQLHQQNFDRDYKKLILVSVGLTLLLLGFGVVMAYWLSVQLQLPIQKLASYARQVGQGNFDERVSIDCAIELSELGNSLNKMSSDLERHTREIQFLAFHDSLTNLPNRRHLLDTLSQIVKASEINNNSFALLFVDIDNFKSINDRYGHDAGDFILTSVVKRIKRCIRSSDILSLASGNDHEQPMLARLAGDEFVVILPQTRESLDAATVSERILEALASPHPWQGSNILLGVSIGIASYPENGSDAETLLSNADAAMYHVKRHEKNNYYFFSEELNERAQQQRLLIRELSQALRNSELELWFQPQVDIHTHKVLGAEALIRWRHPEKGIVTPGQFIPLIEHTDLINDIGLWVVQRTLVFLRSCRTIFPDITLSINVSASQLQNDRRLLQQLRNLGLDSELANKLHLEITETFLVDDENQARESLAALQQLGFSIWLDDFGTGYSALNHLKHYPVDGVKIDQGFVQGIESQWENRTLTQAIISVADAFNIEAIAEGVETQQQKMILQGMGCRSAQGYLFAHPMPENEFLDFLTANQLAQAAGTAQPPSPDTGDSPTASRNKRRRSDS